MLKKWVCTKGWEWLALHELAHVRKGHLPWLFYTRMAVRLTNTALLGLMIPHCFGVGSIFFKGAYLAFLGSLVLQMVVSLKCEWDADLYATQLTHDPEVLQEAEKSLCRMRMQAMGTSLLKRIGYFINCLCVDPHPPWMIRRALLRKKA